MWLIVSEDIYNALWDALGNDHADWFDSSDFSIDMGAMIDAGVYEENEDGFINQYMTPSQEGYFIPNT